MITDRIRLHEVLLPIYHKNYNFREKKNSQGMKEATDAVEETTKIIKFSLTGFLTAHVPYVWKRARKTGSTTQSEGYQKTPPFE